MGAVGSSYKPSLFNAKKYLIYIDYFKEYLVCKDYKSLGTSLKYIFSHKLQDEGYTASSKMGTFFIRPQSTDFQFINFAYERKVKNYIEKNIDSFDVFIDIGACIGEYCIWLAGKGKKCIAIEPVNFETLQKNVALNKMENSIKVFPCGLGSKKERVYFKIPTGVYSSSHIDRDPDKTPNVDIETLDDLLERFDIPQSARVLVKMDVEGMEAEVIEGAKKFIHYFKNLSFIFEQFITEEFITDRALKAVADFSFKKIDGANRVAIKV